MELAASLSLALLRAIGVKGAIILGLLCAIWGLHVYYDGISVPLFGRLVDGRVQASVNAAVAGAQHAYAIQSQNAAAKVRADAEAESKRQSAILTSEYANRLATSQAAAAKTAKDLDDEISSNEALRAAIGVRCALLDDSTADLLREHGFEVDR